MAVHLANADDVFDSVFFCAVLVMSWMRSGIELSQFLRIFLSFFSIKPSLLFPFLWCVPCFQRIFIQNLLCVSGSVHVINSCSGTMMSTTGLEYPYLRRSQAKFRDETSWRGK